MSEDIITGNPTGYRLAPDRVLLDGVYRIADPVGTTVELREGLTAAEPGSEESSDGPHYTVIKYEGLTRLAAMVTPKGRGSFRDQAWETVSIIRAILQQQEEEMALTMQTVFVAEAHHVPIAEKLFEAYFRRQDAADLVRGPAAL